MTLRRIIYGLGIIAACVTGWLLLHHRDSRADKATISQVLPTEDKAKVIIDEKRHTVTTVTRSNAGDSVLERTETKTQFLAPDASIEIKRDDSIVITSRSFGTQHSPWMGVSFDSEAHGRWVIGANLFYWQRLELGGGLSTRIATLDPRLFVSGGYNVYGNILVTATIDNHKAIGIGVAIKF